MNDFENEAFSDDLLGRKAAAKFLTKYLVGRHTVSTSEKENLSFVLNLNAEWGLGKTYFLKEWAKSLKLLGHPVVYFDAWENDFVENPFVGFIIEIKNQLAESLKTDQQFRKAMSDLVIKAEKVARLAIPAVGLAILKNITKVDWQAIGDSLKDVAGDTASGVSKSLLKDAENSKNARAEFKKSLEEIARLIGEKKSQTLPIFLLVDELDRCRPTYAIELLEDIKHIFRVPHVYTVVATDSVQLSHSIRAIYGSGFAADRYLRRFFDHESRLEAPNLAQICKFMLDKRAIIVNETFYNVFSPILNGSADWEVLTLLSRSLKLNVRDFIRTIDIIDSIRVTEKAKLELTLLSFLVMIYVSHNDAYNAYCKSHSAEIVKKSLDNADFNILIYFDEKIESNNGDGRPSKMPILEFCLEYVNAVWSEGNSFVAPKNNITLHLAERSFKNKPAANGLQDYHRLIEFAGSLTL